MLGASGDFAPWTPSTALSWTHWGFIAPLGHHDWEFFCKGIDLLQKQRELPGTLTNFKRLTGTISPPPPPSRASINATVYLCKSYIRTESPKVHKNSTGEKVNGNIFCKLLRGLVHMIPRQLIAPGQLPDPGINFASVHGLTPVTVHTSFSLPRGNFERWVTRCTTPGKGLFTRSNFLIQLFFSPLFKTTIGCVNANF